MDDDDQCLAIVSWSPTTAPPRGPEGRAPVYEKAVRRSPAPSLRDDRDATSPSTAHPESEAGTSAADKVNEEDLGNLDSKPKRGRPPKPVKEKLDGESYVECVDCMEQVQLKMTNCIGGKRCTSRRCKGCHNARRSCLAWYSKQDRLQEWELMTNEEKRQLAVKNKNKGQGKGRKREVLVSEKVQCSDEVGLNHQQPFMTKKQSIPQILC